MDVISIFKELVTIPSPSLNEINVSNKILEYTYNNGINAYYDDYRNLIIRIPSNCDNKKPLLLSAHMDVVGNSSPINLKISDDNKFFETDKTRTLGADDKAGISAALALAIYIAKIFNYIKLIKIPHIPKTIFKNIIYLRPYIKSIFYFFITLLCFRSLKRNTFFFTSV